MASAPSLHVSLRSDILLDELSDELPSVYECEPLPLSGEGRKSISSRIFTTTAQVLRHANTLRRLKPLVRAVRNAAGIDEREPFSVIVALSADTPDNFSYFTEGFLKTIQYGHTTVLWAKSTIATDIKSLRDVTRIDRVADIIGATHIVADVAMDIDGNSESGPDPRELCFVDGNSGFADPVLLSHVTNVILSPYITVTPEKTTALRVSVVRPTLRTPKISRITEVDNGITNPKRLKAEGKSSSLIETTNECLYPLRGLLSSWETEMISMEISDVITSSYKVITDIFGLDTQLELKKTPNIILEDWKPLVAWLLFVAPLALDPNSPDHPNLTVLQLCNLIHPLYPTQVAYLPTSLLPRNPRPERCHIPGATPWNSVRLPDKTELLQAMCAVEWREWFVHYFIPHWSKKIENAFALADATRDSKIQEDMRRVFSNICADPPVKLRALFESAGEEEDPTAQFLPRTWIHHTRGPKLLIDSIHFLSSLRYYLANNITWNNAESEARLSVAQWCKPRVRPPVAREGMRQNARVADPAQLLDELLISVAPACIKRLYADTYRSGIVPRFTARSIFQSGVASAAIGKEVGKTLCSKISTDSLSDITVDVLMALREWTVYNMESIRAPSADREEMLSSIEHALRLEIENCDSYPVNGDKARIVRLDALDKSIQVPCIDAIQMTKTAGPAVTEHKRDLICPYACGEIKDVEDINVEFWKKEVTAFDAIAPSKVIGAGPTEKYHKASKHSACLVRCHTDVVASVETARQKLHSVDSATSPAVIKWLIGELVRRVGMNTPSGKHPASVWAAAAQATYRP